MRVAALAFQAPRFQPMGHLDFHGARVAFWVTEPSEDPLASVPPGAVPTVVGVRTNATRGLVLSASLPLEGDRTLWTVVLQREQGGALVMPWGEQLVAGLGTTALVVDPSGHVAGALEGEHELTGSATAGEALVLLDRHGVSLFGTELQRRWRTPLEADSLLLLEGRPESIKLVAFRAADWTELRLDAATGQILS